MNFQWKQKRRDTSAVSLLKSSLTSRDVPNNDMQAWQCFILTPCFAPQSLHSKVLALNCRSMSMQPCAYGEMYCDVH